MLVPRQTQRWQVAVKGDRKVAVWVKQPWGYQEPCH